MIIPSNKASSAFLSVCGSNFWFRLEYLNSYLMDAVKFGTAVHGSQAIYPTDGLDPLTSPLVLPAV